jgi:hypothetical protein
MRSKGSRGPTVSRNLPLAWQTGSRVESGGPVKLKPNADRDNSGWGSLACFRVRAKREWKRDRYWDSHDRGELQ